MNRRERRIQRTEAGEERYLNHGFRPGAAYSPEGWTRMPEAGILTADERRWTRMGNHKDTNCRSEIRGRECEPTSSGLKSALLRVSGLAVRFGISFLCMVPAESLFGNPPGEGTGPTRQMDSRGNNVGRVPSRGISEKFPNRLLMNLGLPAQAQPRRSQATAYSAHRRIGSQGRRDSWRRRPQGA